MEQKKEDLQNDTKLEKKRKQCEMEHPEDNGCPQTQNDIYRCIKSNANTGIKHDFSQQIGRISFTLIKDHTEIIHQHVVLPRLPYNPKGGREIFATWTPLLDQNDSLAEDFITDANGLELMSRPVFVNKSADFSSSFYPVTSMISLKSEEGKSLTVWNDRP